MDIITAKKSLKDKGYCWFNLKEPFPEHYEYIKSRFKCTPEKNLKPVFKSIRATYTSIDDELNNRINIHTNYTTIEEAEAVHNDVLTKAKDIVQLWSWCWYKQVYEYLHLPDSELNKLSEIYTDIINTLYGEEQEYDHQIDFSYYNIGSQLVEHTDAPGTKRVCACLIYLNEGYKKESGGYLQIDRQVDVIPELGNVAIIDLTRFDIPHAVPPVTEGIGRYAILNFCRIHQN